MSACLGDDQSIACAFVRPAGDASGSTPDTREARHRREESGRETDHREDTERAEWPVRLTRKRAAPEHGNPERNEIGWRRDARARVRRLIGIRCRAMYQVDPVVHGDADEGQHAERAEEIEGEVCGGQEPRTPDNPSSAGKDSASALSHTSRTTIQTRMNTATTPSNRPMVRSCFTRPEISSSTTRSPVTTRLGPASAPPPEMQRLRRGSWRRIRRSQDAPIRNSKNRPMRSPKPWACTLIGQALPGIQHAGSRRRTRRTCRAGSPKPPPLTSSSATTVDGAGTAARIT